MKTIKKNDKLAHLLIIILSFIVFSLVVIMRKVKIPVSENFDTHIFPTISAFLNSIVSVLLLLGLISVKQKRFQRHRNIMLTAVVCSVLFLVTYVSYHFTTVETSYQGNYKFLYYFFLLTHILLAGLVLPFILYVVYRGLTGEYTRHRKLAKIVWPIWFYVSITGVIVYFMISPFYH